MRAIPLELIKWVFLEEEALTSLVKDITYQEIDRVLRDYRFRPARCGLIKVSDYRILNVLFKAGILSKHSYGLSLAIHFGVGKNILRYDSDGLVDTKASFRSITVDDAMAKSENLMQFINCDVEDLIVSIHKANNVITAIKCIAKVVGDTRIIMDVLKATMRSLQPGNYYRRKAAKYLIENGIRMVKVVSYDDVYVIY